MCPCTLLHWGYGRHVSALFLIPCILFIPYSINSFHLMSFTISYTWLVIDFPLHRDVSPCFKCWRVCFLLGDNATEDGENAVSPTVVPWIHVNWIYSCSVCPVNVASAVGRPGRQQDMKTGLIQECDLHLALWPFWALQIWRIRRQLLRKQNCSEKTPPAGGEWTSKLTCIVSIARMLWTSPYNSWDASRGQMQSSEELVRTLMRSQAADRNGSCSI